MRYRYPTERPKCQCSFWHKATVPLSIVKSEPHREDVSQRDEKINQAAISHRLLTVFHVTYPGQCARPQQ